MKLPRKKTTANNVLAIAGLIAANSTPISWQQVCDFIGHLPEVKQLWANGGLTFFKCLVITKFKTVGDNERISTKDY